MNNKTEWTLINFNSYVTSEDYTILNLSLKDISVKYDQRNLFLDTITNFIRVIKESYKDKDLKHQINVDLPREDCYINGIRVKNINEFINEIDHAEKKIVDDALLLSTQATISSVLYKIHDKYFDEKEDIYVSDFSDDNPLIFNFWTITGNNVKVEVSKKFRVVKINNGRFETLKILKVNMFFELYDYQKKIENNNKNNKVLYSIIEL
jgi:hypothetical protein